LLQLGANWCLNQIAVAADGHITVPTVLAFVRHRVEFLAMRTRNFHAQLLYCTLAACSMTSVDSSSIVLATFCLGQGEPLTWHLAQMT